MSPRHTRTFRIEFAPGIFVAVTADASRNHLGDWHIVAEYSWDRGDPALPFEPQGWPALEPIDDQLRLIERGVGAISKLPRQLVGVLDRWYSQLEADDGAPLAKDCDDGS